MRHNGNGQDGIDEEAAKWVVLLGGESVGDADRRSLEQWLAADPRHRAMFQEASDTWKDLGELRQLYRSSEERPLIPYSPMALSAKRFRILRPAIGLAACLLVAIAFGTFWYGDPATLLAADYRTMPGENRTVSLSDGTVVELGSDSALAVHFSDQERRVELLSGIAYFTVAPKAGAETRSFIVASSIGTATAMGTQFSVDRINDAVEVTVIEHKVGVSLTDPGPAHAVLLDEGQSVRYSPEDGLGAVEHKDVGQATAWRRGKLIFSDVPLSRVIAELNRYRRGRIVITSDALARLKVSGVFDTHDLDNALGRITSELKLRTASIPPLVTIIY